MLGLECPRVLMTSPFPLSEERKKAPGDACAVAPSDPSQTQKELLLESRHWLRGMKFTQGHPASDRTSMRTQAWLQRPQQHLLLNGTDRQPLQTLGNLNL